MTGLFPSLIIGFMTGGTWAVAGIQQVDGETVVPLKMAATIAVFVCGLVWWLSHRLTRIESRLDRVEEKTQSIADDLRRPSSGP